MVRKSTVGGGKVQAHLANCPLKFGNIGFVPYWQPVCRFFRALVPYWQAKLRRLFAEIRKFRNPKKLFSSPRRFNKPKSVQQDNFENQIVLIDRLLRKKMSWPKIKKNVLLERLLSEVRCNSNNRSKVNRPMILQVSPFFRAYKDTFSRLQSPQKMLSTVPYLRKIRGTGRLPYLPYPYAPHVQKSLIAYVSTYCYYLENYFASAGLPTISGSMKKLSLLHLVSFSVKQD